MTIPESVTVCECWARDGLQSMLQVVPTAQKLEMIGRMVHAGVPKVEVTSFSHPSFLPQFADAEDILKGLERGVGAKYVVLMPNAKGFDRFAACQREGFGADEIILMISASEAHNTANFRMTHDEAKQEHASIIERAQALGVGVIGCTGTVYGCPIAGDVAMADVVDITAFYINAGCDLIMLGDTTGAANPVIVRERVTELLDRFPSTEFIAHFHDTRGNGVVNSIAALELGLRYVDSSIGAIGGQPTPNATTRKYQSGYTGNTCTEDLVALLDEMGVATGIDVDLLIETGRRAEEVLGEHLRSNVVRSGRVNHVPREFQPA